MSIPARLLSRALAVPIEVELARRGHKLKRVGGEHIGPCPVCGGTDRFGANIRKRVAHCRGCGLSGDVVTIVRALDGSTFAEAVALLAGEDLARPRAMPAVRAQRTTDEANDQYERQQHRKAAWLWSQRRPIAGTPAETYLRARGIWCPLPPTLGFLPPSKPEHHPALITAFGLVDELEPGELSAPRDVATVHLTLLRPDGSGKVEIKPNKIIVGGHSGCPIVLAPPNDTMTLAVTEGVEDALSLHQALGIGAWAAYSAGAMPKLATHVPNHIETVLIEVHPDDGRRHALELARTLRTRGVEVIMREARA